MTKCVIPPCYVDKAGYGRVRRNGKTFLAHRWEWLSKVGHIPKGMCVLHSCDNPPCVNIKHLFLGTHADNMKDMALKKRARCSKKTHCLRGHPFTEDNIYWHRQKRLCLVCKRTGDKLRARKYREAKSC